MLTARLALPRKNFKGGTLLPLTETDCTDAPETRHIERRITFKKTVGL